MTKNVLRGLKRMSWLVALVCGGIAAFGVRGAAESYLDRVTIVAGVGVFIGTFGLFRMVIWVAQGFNKENDWRPPKAPKDF